MAKENFDNSFSNLPSCAADYIRDVIKKMRWQKKVRADVQAELISHFENALKDCKTNEEKEKTAKGLISDFGDAKLIAVLACRAKKRCRPMWQKVLVHSLQALGIIILYIVICAGYIGIGKPNISVNYIEWLNEYARQGRDESLNCAPMLNEAAELIIKMPEWLNDSNMIWPSDFNETQLQELENWLAQNTEALETLGKALDKPYYWSIYDSNESDLMKSNFLSVSKYRSLAKTMNWKIRYLAYKNNTEEAVNNAIKLCSLGQKMEGNGLLIEQLVGIAIEAMGHSAILEMLDRTMLTTEQLERIQNFFQQYYNDSIIDISAEKACLYDFIQRNFTDDGKGGGRPLRQGIGFAGKNTPETILNILLFHLPNRKEVITQMDNLYENFQQGFEISNYKKREELYKQSIKNTPLMLQTLTPAVGKVATLVWRLKTDRDGLITTLAILRYHRKNNSYPESLDELLNKGYIKQIPFDEFRDGPLTYRKTDDSFILYSFGVDFDDDNGIPTLGKWGKDSESGDRVFWPVSHPKK
ncbi:MAG: hypothetical protein ABSE89_01120 [Sedimentisphaerales bacterium]